jgi:SAM-dependent methyltransferase
MNEPEQVRERYARRGDIPERADFFRNVVAERDEIYGRVMKQKFGDLSKLTLLEIGAGSGSNTSFFHALGLPWKNIHANELLDERIAKLKKNFPEIHIHPGDACRLESSNRFDVVFQSMVFTSILDLQFKRKLASKMLDLVKPGGIVLWYDFRYNNPANKDVKGISVEEIVQLFPVEKIDLYRVTLAPPIGRRIGRLYNLVNAIFPFLRTHVVAVIHKK